MKGMYVGKEGLWLFSAYRGDVANKDEELGKVKLYTVNYCVNGEGMR